ncbi:hypothetical protein AWP88_08105 [Escherichia coli]|uniref:DUF7167 family protein n=1 Tax=Escherichia coli TaxID=562 RepID=UPI0005117BF0|nr:hypothetical protein [Escherichia coli]OKV67552.1 hypothetical protein AWP61_09505 [Escherichia coli]OKW93425.1 hypothetical protein AWP88_08105 [Escherichia coli]WNT90376.1 hypothetical protein QMY53_04406 [Escherichia coli TW14425]
MRKFKIIIETGIAGGDFEDEFEVDNDATPDEIHDEAKDIFFNYCNGNDSNLLIVFYVQIMPDDFVMQLHRF